MFNVRNIARRIALAGAFPLLLASAALAQDYYPRTDQPVVTSRGFANRIVEGTVASVAPARFGERIRLTNGMDLVVPQSVVPTNQGRNYQWSMLRPGDVVRMAVWSREGDGRDARVRSVELLRSSTGYGSGYYNDRNITGTVLSLDRRNDVLVMQTDNGRTFNVSLVNNDVRVRRGDRITVTGRMDRGNGVFVAAGVSVSPRY
jgi:hypothetical protein